MRGFGPISAAAVAAQGYICALFALPLQLQGARYIGNPDVQVTQLANTAHGFDYEASHLESVALVDEWLSAPGG